MTRRSAEGTPGVSRSWEGGGKEGGCARPTTAGAGGGPREVGDGGERSGERGYSGPKSSDVEHSAYRSSRGRGAHREAGRGGACALPAAGPLAEARARLSKSGRARGAEGVRALLWDAPASLGPALETEGWVGCAVLATWVTLHYSPCPLQARPSRTKGSGRKGLKVFVGSWGGKLVARGEPDNYSGQLPFSRVPGND